MSRRLNPLPQLVADRLARIQANVDRSIWAPARASGRGRKPGDGRDARRGAGSGPRLYPRHSRRALRCPARRLVAPVVSRADSGRPGGRARPALPALEMPGGDDRVHRRRAVGGPGSRPSDLPRFPTRRPPSTWTPPPGRPASGPHRPRSRSARTGCASTSPSCASATSPPGT